MNMESTTNADIIPVRVGQALQRLGLSLFSESRDLIDWREVAGVAIDVVGERWTEAAVPREALAEFAGYVNRVTPAVAEFTGLEPVTPIGEPVVFNRSEWIVTTTRTAKPLIEPFLEQIVGAKRGPAVRLLKTAMWGELGVVIGYLAKRVLGQYDISLLEPQRTDGQLFFVYPNIVETEARLGVDGEEFRMWLALHEVTHAFEFQAHPWLREHISGLINDQFAYLKQRLGKAEASGEKEQPVSRLLGGLLVPGGWRDLMSVDENPVLAKTQAVMSVLEGYSEFVMERAGALVGGENNIAEMFDHARRSKNLANKLFERLIGLHVKIDQYQLGYQFISQATEAGGMALANRVWEGPRNLPTLTELRRPELWVARMLK